MRRPHALAAASPWHAAAALERIVAQPVTANGPGTWEDRSALFILGYFVVVGAVLVTLLLWVSSVLPPVPPPIPTSQVVGLPEAYRGTTHPSFEYAPDDLGPQPVHAKAAASAPAGAAAAHAEAPAEHKVTRRHRVPVQPEAQRDPERREYTGRSAAPFARDPVP